MWVPVSAYTGCQLSVAALNAVEAPQDCRPCGASIHNVIGANTMAFTHSTQTRPKFTYLFLGTPSDLPTCTPTVLRAEADTEAEARAKFIDWDLTFAAQIRTAAPSRLQLFSTDDGFMWIYEQRQEASHA
ncbi:host cell division inhibitor Icd-like protein [Hafnia sp. HMSC23F03]|uniref:host cell division inhibitor Icd-like protein n=1 Tax=Hafnia sp. HMSC23F03 TaxID=1581059 RepID=UPI00352B64D8